MASWSIQTNVWSHAAHTLGLAIGQYHLQTELESLRKWYHWLINLYELAMHGTMSVSVSFSLSAHTAIAALCPLFAYSAPSALVALAQC